MCSEILLDHFPSELFQKNLLNWCVRKPFIVFLSLSRGFSQKQKACLPNIYFDNNCDILGWEGVEYSKDIIPIAFLKEMVTTVRHK